MGFRLFGNVIWLGFFDGIYAVILLGFCWLQHLSKQICISSLRDIVIALLKSMNAYCEVLLISYKRGLIQVFTKENGDSAV